MKFKRVFLIVMDSFGVGELPDAEKFGDVGSNTLKSVSSSPYFCAPNLTRLGLFSIPGTGNERSTKCRGIYGKAAELSAGKDTVTGHWELAGLVSDQPMPTYPDGFPQDILDEIEKKTGVGAICNKTYSGTEVIKDYYNEHKETGKMIVYTSADSVYQAAAHNDIIPIDKLYEYCKIVREILKGKNSVGRVIARPFIGDYPDLKRTSDRHDYALEPHGETILDVLKKADKDVITVGKISDIFAARGITRSYPTKSNNDGMETLKNIAKTNFNGLCFVNLVDFDSSYGHRNDIDGYAKAVTEFDIHLGNFISQMKKDDLLIVTADHGCDPKTESTDHSREYVPILCYCRGTKGNEIGTRESFTDVGKTVLDVLDVKNNIKGKSFSEYIR